VSAGAVSPAGTPAALPVEAILGRAPMDDDRSSASMRMVTVKFLTVAFWQVGYARIPSA
jgi:hypothetical protein